MSKHRVPKNKLTQAERNRLVTENTGLVGDFLRKWTLGGMNTGRVWRFGTLEDAFQVGAMGLMAAAERWNPHRKPPIKFGTYALYWVHSVLTRGEALGALIYVPPKQKNSCRHLEAGERAKRIGHFEDDHENEVIDHRLPLDEDCGSDVHAALKSLDRRTRAMVRRRYVNRETLVSIGREFGVSKERVRQITKVALKRMRLVVESRLSGETI